MKAVVCKQFGPPEGVVWEEVPTPTAGPGELIVEVHAIGVNFTDLLAVEGRSQLKRQPPIIPGTEVAGVVKAVGEGTNGVKVGQRVLGTLVHGAYAEFVRFRPQDVYPIPDEMDFRTAAAFFIASMTSRHALVDRGRLKAGENLLVLGAGSGAGLAAVEIGKALGARVVAAASSDDKLEIAKARGADSLVRYSREPLDVEGQKSFCAALKAASGTAESSDRISIGRLSTLAGEAGYDVVYDAVGGTYAEPALRALAYEGRYLSVGFSAGVPALSLGPVLFKSADILGVQPAADDLRLPGLIPQAMEQMFGWYKAGQLLPQITEVLPLERASEALRSLKDRKAKGRIVLVTEIGRR